MNMAHSESVGTARLNGTRGTGGTGGGGPPLHATTLLLLRVTAPFRARVLPFKLAPLFNVMLLSAMMFPCIAVVVPMVAELVTCHHTPQAAAPLIRTTAEPVAVVSELAVWKM